jgi:predicted Holliday junction resolvase-like endonuclease
MEILVLILAIVIAVLSAAIYRLKGRERKLKLQAVTTAQDFATERIKIHQDSKFRSAAANWGFTIENFVPFIDTFPVPPQDVNFLGKPIDYVGFTDTESKTLCKVHFIEVKSGSALLTAKQRNIKKAIEEGRVQWHEVRVGSNKPK